MHILQEKEVEGREQHSSTDGYRNGSVACTIYFIINGPLRAGARTLRELISKGRKTCSGGLLAELLRCAQVLLFIQQAGLVNEIFSEDCAPESRMERLEELLQSKDGIIDLPRPVRVRLVYSCTSKRSGKNEYIGEFVVKHGGLRCRQVRRW